MKEPSDYLEKLNVEQRRAVEFGLDHGEASRPLLIIAGAGSGKTNALAHRVAHLIVRGIDPRRILLMTFTRRAAAEMTRRAEGIAAKALGSDAVTLISGLQWAGTFHGIGARLLREYAHLIGLDPAFTIHDRGDSADLMNLVRHERGLSRTEQRFPKKGTCLSIYSRVVNEQAELDDVLESVFPWCAMWGDELRSLFEAYVEAKQAQNVMDYDDLLLWWAQIMAVPELAGEIARRFDHVLVDEYQDTNSLQASILLGLKPDGRGLAVVGDDAQSIYSFRSASVRNILDFPNHFTPPATVVSLEQNYRSTKPILAAANAVIELAEERFTKNLWTERSGGYKPSLVSVRDEADQARYVVEQVLENRERGMDLKDQAVLFRASHHSGQLEIELTQKNIPFVKFGGLKFLEAAHVKDVLSTLRFAENPRDRVSGFRVLQLMPGIGAKTASQVLDRHLTMDDLAAAFEQSVSSRVAPEDWQGFADLVRGLRTGLATWPAELEEVLHWYEPHLEREYDNAHVRMADLVQLGQIATTYPTRERFLTELTLDPPQATSDEAGPPLLDEDYLILSTIHSAKGQEWKAVYLLNTVDGCIPSDLATGSTEEIEEERRLLYVAITRARDSLDLIVPQRFFVRGQSAHGDGHVYASRTRFIPDALLQHFDLTSWPVAADDDHARTALGPKVDVASQMRAMWR